MGKSTWVRLINAVAPQSAVSCGLAAFYAFAGVDVNVSLYGVERRVEVNLIA